MTDDPRIFVGITTGPAGDGLDLAVAEIAGRGETMRATALASETVPWPQDLGEQIRAASSVASAASAPDFAHLDRRVTREIAAQACRFLAETAQSLPRLPRRGQPLPPTAGCEPPRPALAGCCASGVLLAELPASDQRPATALTAGDPATLAAALDAPVTFNPAATDRAHGGLGGPVEAWPTWKLLRDERLSRVAVHLGAVATITFVPAGSVATDVVAFDVAPAGLLADAVARARFDQPCDTDGALAARGKPSGELAHELLARDFYRKAPPKRIDITDFRTTHLPRMWMMARKHRIDGEDLLATLAEVTARAVADAVDALTERPHQVVLTGGGAHNIHLAMRIRTLLSPCSTVSSEAFDVPPRAWAAICHAMLAAARQDAFAAHCPSATGARSEAVLGTLAMP